MFVDERYPGHVFTRIEVGSLADLPAIITGFQEGKTIALSMVYNMLKSPFYYGAFEYPKGSGNWYQGKNEPLITKELFAQVQEQLIVPLKPKLGAKEFPFKRFLRCGGCGASIIVGESKIRTLKNEKSSPLPITTALGR